MIITIIIIPYIYNDQACSGALTIESGISSYAAVALRNMGKCGIVGAVNMTIG